MRNGGQSLMSRLIIISNRLPVSVEKRQGRYVFHQSTGGVATGLSSVVRERDCIWLGWPGVSSARITAAERQEITETLRSEHSCWPVFLPAADVSGFYHGFSNRTLWPLFHHFTKYAEFDWEYWRAYVRVNRVYRDALLDLYQPGDQIWIHDYQLMLLPGLIRESLPDASIGFFLHIPFPSYEVFRILPWRSEILAGLLGADLIGFHTFDYARQFTESVKLLLGLDAHNSRVDMDGRQVTVKAFPMGIDVCKFERGAESPVARRYARRLRGGGSRIVLSVDRLDYTKGIPERLAAFDTFLARHPEWRGRVRLICVAVPSRTRVERYLELMAEVDGLVGAINGRWGTVDWSPVTYLCRSVPLQSLIGMYTAADVALVTPLRDGMNLVAKEYVASRINGTGVLVLSEMAGAARELQEALQVNPYDIEAMVSAIETALEMPEDEQVSRNRSMQKRLKRYDIDRWTQDFLESLAEAKFVQASYGEHPLQLPDRRRLLGEAKSATTRVIVLDYDGTLVPFAPTPDAAVPDTKLLVLLRLLASDPCTTLLIVSGRDRATLESWLGETGAILIAEHGAWLREVGGDWVTTTPFVDEWKPKIRQTLERFVDRTPGSFIEEKDFSLVWHYRLARQDQARLQVREIVRELSALTAMSGLRILEGSDVLEVKPVCIDKGRAAHQWMTGTRNAFVLVIGDDTTDESLFEVAPEHAWTVKVRPGHSMARASLQSWEDARQLLSDLAEVIA